MIIRNTTLGRPSSFAIDFAEDRLCYGDTLLRTISCMNFDGSNAYVLPVESPIPVAIAILGGMLDQYIFFLLSVLFRLSDLTVSLSPAQYHA